MAVITVILLLVLLLGVFAMSLPLYVAWPIYGIVLVGASIVNTVHMVFLALLWLVWLAVGLFFGISKIRKGWMVYPLLRKIRRSFPQMSQTEKDAIDAGDVWWEGQLFMGKPKWKNLFEYPVPKLTQEEQEFMDNQVTHLCQMINNWEVLNNRDLPKEVWDYLKQEKFFGLIIPKEYGGLGFSPFAHSTMVMKLSTQSATCAVTAMVPNSLGPAELLLKYGTEDQKQYYLPRLAAGDEIPCFGLTSVDAGSDAGNMTDYGIVCFGEHEGKKTLGMRLTWSKRYITLAPVSTVIGLAIKLFDPDKLLGDQENLGVTVCLIPTSHPGVEVGRRHWPMLLSFMNGPTKGEDVFVPMDWIIGGQDRIGQGWRMLMECLSEGRGISLPAISTAGCKVMYRMSGAYAKVRRQFKLPISQFEGVREALAEIAGKTFMLQAMRVFVAGAVQEGLSPAIASAIAKYHMTEMARDVVNAGMDIHGGKALQTGPNNYMFPSYLSVPMGITVEGANIMTRSLIIFGQGSVRCHPYLLQEIQILSESGKGQINRFDTVLSRHIRYGLANLARAIFYGFTAGRLITVKGVPKPVRSYVRQLTRLSNAFALLADIAFLVLGGRIKRKESLSARLGDALSYLFIASAVIKYHADNNCPKHQKAYVEWSVKYCLWKTQDAMRQCLDNFPVRWLAMVMKRIVFPWGRSYRRPSDQLNESIVKPMVELSDIRAELSEGCFVEPGKHNAKAWLEKAFHDSLELSPLLKQWSRIKSKGLVPGFGDHASRIDAAVEKDLLTKEEAQKLKALITLREKVISVDEFDFDLKEVLYPHMDS